MKLIRAFIALQYVSLAGITAIPMIIASAISKEVHRILPALANVFLILLILFILVITVVIEISGAEKIRKFLNNGETENAVKMWKQMKLISIPFYIVNYIICFTFASITFPISLISIPLDYIFCWIMIIVSGIVGIRVIKSLKDTKISFIHYIFQVLPVFDVISTLIISKKMKSNEKAAVQV